MDYPPSLYPSCAAASTVPESTLSLVATSLYHGLLDIIAFYYKIDTGALWSTLLATKLSSHRVSESQVCFILSKSNERNTLSPLSEVGGLGLQKVLQVSLIIMYNPGVGSEVERTHDLEVVSWYRMLMDGRAYLELQPNWGRMWIIQELAIPEIVYLIRGAYLLDCRLNRNSVPDIYPHTYVTRVSICHAI